MKYILTNGSKRQMTINHSGDCELCGSRNNSVIYDAAIIHESNPGRRVWAWTCPTCFTKSRGRLGIGCGQEYTITE